MVSKLKYFLSFAVLALCLGLFTPKASADGVRVAYTPASVVDSTYMIMAYDKDGDEQWSGTAWKIAEGAMMTAGHVCDPKGEDGMKFRVKSRWNQEYPVSVVKFSRDPDLCLLNAPHVPGEPMDDIAPHPAYGDRVWYSGAPHGIFGDGTVPFAQGFYIGGNKMMIAGYPGASGSAVYTRDGVIGVLVAGWRGTHLIVFVPTGAMIQFLKE